jgi:hypothetical protein
MIALDDSRWAGLKGGYKVPYDPRPALSALESGGDIKDRWDELWQELHHQGDVGEASYAAVPQLVRIHCHVRPLGWNLFALVSTIEMERHRKRNPPLPDWLDADYRGACQELLEAALTALRQTQDELEFRSALGFVALTRGHVKLGSMVSTLDQSEIDEWVEERLAWSELYA